VYRLYSYKVNWDWVWYLYWLCIVCGRTTYSCV